MSLQDIALYSGGGLLLLLTFVQISPIKIIHGVGWLDVLAEHLIKIYLTK